ncbi:hypothetical protein KR032_003600 [Drosophila birchii]|nr:hypothetical protein KR032_003600 [Drosophila birchii]
MKMFLSRSLFAAQQLLHQQQRSITSRRRVRYQYRPVPVEIPTRSFTRTDLKRPPLLLVKSFLNLRQMNVHNGEDMSRVTNELSFQPHRHILVNILPFSNQHLDEMDNSEER